MATIFEHGRFDITVVPAGEPWGELCYVVGDRVAQERIILDPGARPEAIERAADDDSARVTAIVLTHAHHDHVLAAAEVAEYYGVQCYVHSADFPLLRKAPMYAVAFGGRPFPTVTDPVPLESEDKLAFASGQMRTLHTPGHTPGSCCLLFPGFAFTGDTLLQGAIGRTDLPGSDRGALVSSVDELLSQTADDDVLYGGHREPWRASDARRWWAETRGDGRRRASPRSM